MNGESEDHDDTSGPEEPPHLPIMRTGQCKLALSCVQLCVAINTGTGQWGEVKTGAAGACLVRATVRRMSQQDTRQPGKLSIPYEDSWQSAMNDANLN